MPRATCRRSTRDRHHRRSGVSARPSVPPRSRSDQPFGRYSRKCLDTQTHRQTDKHDPANFFSASHRRKSSFIRTCYAKALPPFILYDFGLEAGIAKHCLGPKSEIQQRLSLIKDLFLRQRCLTSFHERTCSMHPTI